MAGSTFYGSTNNQYLTPKIVWSSTPNIVGNYSTVTATLYVSRNNTGYTTSGTWSGGISIDGNTATASKSVSISYNSNTMMVSNTFNVAHGADGVGYVNISAYGGIPGTSYTSTSISGQFQLDTIPRTSTFSLSYTNFTIGNNITISINPASGSFNHRIYMEWGEMTTLATGVGSSYVWNTGNNEAQFYKYIPNDEYSFGAVHVDTYSGSTFIGRNSIRFQANVPSGAVPTIDSVTITQATTDIQNKFGGFVQSKSRATIITSATGAKGSGIKSVNVNVEGINYATSGVTTNYLTGSGNVVATITVTDSRGRPTTTTRTISVMSYSPPTISSLSIQRCDVNSVIKDEGTYVKVVANGQVASIGTKNTYACTLYYKPKTSSTWSSYPVTMTSNVLSINTKFGSGNFSPNTSYDFRLDLSDYFTTTSVINSISTASPPMDFKSGGKGVAFGKVAELENYCDIGWDTMVLGKVLQTEKIIYHPSNGVLVDLLPATTLGQMITIEVTGNGYGGGMPINTIIQGYHNTPQGTIISCYQLNLGADMAMAKFMIHNGRLKVWFTQPSSWSTLKIKAYTQNTPLNYITVTSDLEPAGTSKVTCAKCVSHIDLYNSVAVSKATPTPASESKYIEGIVTKQNNYVTIDSLSFASIYGDSNSFASGAVVGILPAGYRPLRNIRVACIIGRAGSYPASLELAIITPNGNIVASLWNNTVAFQSLTMHNTSYYVG